MEQNTVNNYPYPEKKAKKFFITDKSDIIMLIFIITATFTALYEFMFDSYGAYSAKHTVIYLLSLALSTVYITKKQHSFNKKSIPIFVFCVLLSITFSIHTDILLGMLTVAVLIAMTFAYFTVLTKSNHHPTKSFMFLSDLLHTSVFTPVNNLFLPYISLNKTRKTAKPNKNKISKNTIYALAGTAAGIIALCIIIPLLISSDAMFENAVDTVFGSFKANIADWFDNIGDKIFRVLICLYGTMWIFPFLFSALFSFKNDEARLNNKNKIGFYNKIRKVPTVFFTALLSVISVAYLLYIFTQIAYLFSAFTGSLPSDTAYSLSEYARRGFFEMIAVSVINFILISLTVLFTKRKSNRISGFTKYLDIFLSLFCILTSVISISKIMLYIDKYGLTYRRISVIAINIVIIASFISIAVKMFISKLPYMKIIVCTICTVIIALGVLGIDNIAVQYNYNLYKNNPAAEFDAECFANENGLEYLIEFAKEGNKEAEAVLSDYYSYTLIYDYKDDICFDTIDRYKTRKLISENKAYLDTLYTEETEELF